MTLKNFEKYLRKIEDEGHDFYEYYLRTIVSEGNFKPGDIVGKSYRDWKMDAIIEKVKEIEF